MYRYGNLFTCSGISSHVGGTQSSTYKTAYTTAHNHIINKGAVCWFILYNYITFHGAKNIKSLQHFVRLLSFRMFDAAVRTSSKIHSSYFELSDLKFLMNQYCISTSTHCILHLFLFSYYFSVSNSFIFLFFPLTLKFLKAMPSVPVIGKTLTKHPLNLNILLSYHFSINSSQFSYPEDEGNTFL